MTDQETTAFEQLKKQGLITDYKINPNGDIYIQPKQSVDHITVAPGLIGEEAAKELDKEFWKYANKKISEDIANDLIKELIAFDPPPKKEDDQSLQDMVTSLRYAISQSTAVPERFLFGETSAPANEEEWDKAFSSANAKLMARISKSSIELTWKVVAVNHYGKCHPKAAKRKRIQNKWKNRYKKEFGPLVQLIGELHGHE